MAASGGRTGGGESIRQNGGKRWRLVKARVEAADAASGGNINDNAFSFCYYNASLRASAAAAPFSPCCAAPAFSLLGYLSRYGGTHHGTL
jgi:hypothetical protein